MKLTVSNESRLFFCSVEGCYSPADRIGSAGLCLKHLQEWDARMDAKTTARYEEEDERLSQENEETGV